MKKQTKLWLACAMSFASLILSTQAQITPTEPANVVSNYYTVEYSTTIPITDGSTKLFNLPITNAIGKIWDVNLRTELPHTWSANLDVYLTSPQGTKVPITTGNGSTFDNVFSGTWWDDQAPTNAADASYVNLVAQPTLQPDGAMSAFDGENPNGTWILTVTDNTVDGNVGFINNAKLDIRTYVGQPSYVTKSYTNSVSTPIPDAMGSISPTVSVTGLPYRISEVKVFTKIPHTFSTDLDVSLTSPEGTQVNLITDNGGGNDNIFDGTLWYDNAAEAAADLTVPYANNVVKTNLVPEGCLGAFKGENPNGIWTLTVADDNNLGQSGTLDNWYLEITTASAGVNDVNGDGYTDIIGVKRKEVRVLAQQAGQAASKAVNYGRIPSRYYKAAGSYMVNDDGTSDLILQYGFEIVYLASSNGTFSSTPIPLTSVLNPHYKVCASGDINSDDYTDFVVMRKKEIGVILGGFNQMNTFKTITEQSQNGKVVGVIGANIICQKGRSVYRVPIKSDGTNTVVADDAVVLTENVAGKVVGISEIDGKDGYEILVQRRKTITYGTWDSGNYTTALWSDIGKEREDRVGKVVAPQ